MVDDALLVAERFFRAVETGDTDEVARVYAPDARIWHNFSQAEQTVEENLKVLRWMARKLPGRRYDVLRRVVIPGGFMQQHVVRGTLADGSAFAMPACVVCLVENGRIVRLEEYLDPAQAAVLSA
ncbi:nuclear transport factor 2 family protein [Parvibaculum sp.]|uniref:nuclear transport factor 2 family protein n=1 Tax=Parvibaculum sp. TaxID=2024848 RepID=UPI001E1A6160|nr:nuclear transport factor 2 family protein [Parvibaculum sp.]MBX3489708.1 nuclear transport factor 2 family protein [Parvibaculum sp.]MCW5726334.1 nuclear transport factor 2 family protein [Parvibaculum sp.]